jgi:hypothetical protein
VALRDCSRRGPSTLTRNTSPWRASFVAAAVEVIADADKWLRDLGDFFAVRRRMNDVASSDRRRVPRAVIADTELSVLAFPIPVRLLDISLGGVLLESSHPVDLGTRGTLRFNFGGTPFSTAL